MVLPVLLLLSASLHGPAVPAAGPEITLWYGRHQVFGRRGVPQRWVNVLGNAHDPDGIASLSFSLNGGPERLLAVGPDQRRLAGLGDFNVEIDYAELVPGTNAVVITAIDRKDHRSAETVTVEVVAPSARDANYTIDWDAVDHLADAVQVIDGLWIRDGGGIRTAPAHVGYDRTVAIGDASWQDYEVTVPVTIHAVDETAFDVPTSGSPGVGVYLRWQGHTDVPVKCPQPHCGWNPNGASNWYQWQRDGPDLLHLYAGPTSLPAPKSANTDETRFEPGHTYWFKARVETTPAGSLYGLKVWEDGVEAEPADWDLQRLTTTANLARGSLLLIAHHVDATFGNLAVLPLPAKKRWDLFTELSSYLGRAPLLFVSLVGLTVAYVGRHRWAAQSRRVLIAMALLFFGGLIGAWLNLHLPELLQERGWTAKRVTLATVVSEFAASAVMALAWGLALLAIFVRPVEPS